MTEKIPPSYNPEKKDVKKTSSADVKAFEKLLGVEKISETELEKRKKKKIPQEEKIAKKEEALFSTPSKKIFTPEKKEKISEEIDHGKIDKDLHIELPKKTIKQTKENKADVIKQHPSPIQKKEPLKKSLKQEKPSDFATFQIPSLIQQTASLKIDPVKPSIHKEIQPVIEHVIGTIMTMQKNGISETKIILNNPQFSSSRFYGTKIIITQYETAPDSFNITLQGPQEAINIINNNIEGLYNIFTKQDFGFTINRIDAEYEYLIRRKPSASDKKKDKDET